MVRSMIILIKQVKSQLQTYGIPFITDLIIFITWNTPTATDLVSDCYGKLKPSNVIIPIQLGVTPLWCSVYVTYSTSHWQWYISKQMQFPNAWNAAFQNCILCRKFSVMVEPRSLIWRIFFTSTSPLQLQCIAHPPYKVEALLSLHNLHLL